MAFDPTSVKVTCVTLPKDHCVQVPWEYINVCGYSDQFCKLPHTYIHIRRTYTTYSSLLLNSVQARQKGKYPEFCMGYSDKIWYVGSGGHKCHPCGPSNGGPCCIFCEYNKHISRELQNSIVSIFFFFFFALQHYCHYCKVVENYWPFL